jgi:lysozyme family protein
MFKKAVAHILKWEGGYSNNPKDKGGETKYGISKRAYPDLNIKDLTIEEAENIYEKDYWLACRCDKMSFSIALNVFDTAVNMGDVTSIRILQEALKVKVDGIIGDKTIGALENIDEKDLVVKFSAIRMMKYTSYEGWEEFGLGWTRRLIDTSIVAFK